LGPAVFFFIKNLADAHEDTVFARISLLVSR